MTYFRDILVFLLIINCSLNVCNSNPEVSKYDTRYDGIDLDDMLNNERLLKNYIKCLLNQGPCTPDAKSLKETIPDAMQTDCSKCSEKQKFGVDKVNHFLIEHKPEEWEKLEKKYDPEGAYRKRYMEEKNKTNESQSEMVTEKIVE